MALGVGPVGAPHEAVSTDDLSDGPQTLLDGLGAYPALALEVLAGLHGKDGVEAEAGELEVEEVEPVGDPGGADLDHGDAKVGELFEDALGHHVCEGEEGVAEDHGLDEELGAEAGVVGVEVLAHVVGVEDDVERYGHVEVLGGGPEWDRSRSLRNGCRSRAPGR